MLMFFLKAGNYLIKLIGLMTISKLKPGSRFSAPIDDRLAAAD